MNAENIALKGIAAKDCHKVYATVDGNTNQEATAEISRRMLDELKGEVKG